MCEVELTFPGGAKPFHGVSLLPTTGLLAQPKWEGDTTVYVLILP